MKENSVMVFRTSPPADNHKSLIPILRTKAGPGLRVVVLSDEWIWLPTHYNGKRTIICEDDADCQWCAKQVQVWKGFIVVREFAGDRHALLSITPNVVEAMKTGRDRYNGLVGLVVHFTRLGNEVNSPLAANVQSRIASTVPISWRETLLHIQRVFKCGVESVMLGAEPLKPVEWRNVGKMPE